MSDYTLTEPERAALLTIRDQGLPAEARRARIILLSAEGTTVSRIVEAVGLSASYVHRLRREWKQRRLNMFSPDVSDEETIPDVTVIVPASVDVKPTESVPELVTPPAPGVETPRLPLDLRDTVGVHPDDAMAEAARKALLFNFERMLLNEPGTRLGETIEAVHDMRVATRRMRSAFRLFQPFFKNNAIKPYRHGLGDVADALGTVRDLDVFMDKAQRFAQKHPDITLIPLFEVLQKRLEKARRVLLHHLDSKGFARFVNQFHTFLTTPGAGAHALPDADEAVAYQVRHIAPRLIYEHYERVRAYETVLEGAPISTLHALRIDFKRFRYTLEFFEEVLGPEIKSVVKETKIMQDHLGDLNDTQVAGDMLREIIDGHQREYSGVPIIMRPDMSGVMQYALVVDAEQQRLLAAFPAVWANFNRDNVRRDLALAVAAL